MRNLRITAALSVAVVLSVAALGAPSAFAAFGVLSFDGGTFKQNGNAYTQAGGHPYDASSSIELNREVVEGAELPTVQSEGGAFRNTSVELPPGLIGNPTAATQCSRTLRVPTTADAQEAAEDPGKFCPVTSIVGLALITLGYPGPEIQTTPAPVFSVEPPPGVAASFGFDIVTGPAFLDATVRGNGDYGITVRARNTIQAVRLLGAKVTLWGTPADPSHDPLRCLSMSQAPIEIIPPTCTGAPGTPGGPNSAGIPQRAFLTNPTACTPPGVGLETRIHVESWNPSSPPADASFISHLPPGISFPTPSGGTPLPPDQWGAPQGPDGCADVPFNPTVSLRPTSHEADSPTGLSVDISVPTAGLEDPSEIAQSNLKQAVVTLPEGMTVNPSSASGLGSCSPAQLEAETLDSAPGEGCPLASKIGSVDIDTPLLADPVRGSVYLAKQNDNPFNSLLALYIVVKNPERGVIIKLSGEVEPDPVTGRLTTSFDDNPQLPFSNLHLEFKDGPRAPLITPPSCGTYTSDADFSPWARPSEPLHLTSSFAISSGPGGAPCPSAGQLDPGFQAGTATPIAGIYSPLIVNASRPDGSQALRGLTVNLPPGLTGKLAGVPYCPEPAIAAAIARNQPGQGALELASPSCPAASKVGTVDVGAGAGSTPFHAQGTAYLAGAYKGAPLSLAVITPAIAGPFDLGTVVVRAALRVDPTTAQITAVSDPVPQILQGIPLKIRSVSVATDRPEFTLNPTNCEPFALSGTLFGTSTSKPVSNRFQVGACKALDFAPKLSLQFSGAPTHRGGHPKLKAVLTAGKGDANIGRAVVTLPKTELLENAHIGTICTRPQYAADACPAKSVYGYAKAWTPLLDKPLQGPVYLRANGGERDLPDLVAKLDGQIHVDLVGYIDAVNARIRNTFALVPDAPVSRFELTMKGGAKGLLVHNTNICRTTPRAEVRFIGQNGKVEQINPAVKTGCSK